MSALKTLKISTANFLHHARCGYVASNVTETEPRSCAAKCTGQSKMAGQVRVLQLDAEQELETKLYRLEKGKVFLFEEPKVLV